MKQATAEYIRNVYNTQWENAMKLKKPTGKQTSAYKEQKAYYDGMMEMLMIVATEAYTVSRKSISDFLSEATD